MTSPFPTQFNQGAQFNPGMNGTIADVLAQMQVQQESQRRNQELQNSIAHQRALQAYYEAQARAQAEEQARLAGESLLAQAGQREVGGAVRSYLQGGQPGVFSPTSASTQPGIGQGNIFRDIVGGAGQALSGADPSIYGKVSDQNMLPAVKAVQEAQALRPKAPELPNAGKEFMFAQELAKIDPKLSKFFVENWVNPPKGPGTVVNVGGEPTPYSKEYDASKAKGTTAAAVEGTKAWRAMPVVGEAYSLLTKGNVITGLFQKPSLAVSRMAAAMGVESEKLRTADTQTRLKLTGENVFTYLASRDLGSGTAVSDGDREFAFSLAGRDLTQDKLALRRTLRINFGTLLMKQQQAMDELRNDALNYPERARQIGRDSALIQKQYETGWKQYAGMLVDEGSTPDEIRVKLANTGLSIPAIEQILKSLPATNLQRLGDDVFGPSR